MLELISIKKKYITKAGETLALNDVSLRFPDKGMVFITGKSGSGKTTLLNVIGGLDDFDSGEINVDDKSFSNFSSADFDSYRNTYVGFVFQEYNLLPEYNVIKNVALAEELQGKKVNKSLTDKLFEDMEISGLEERKVSQLSGGQKQRVAIVRALAKSSKIILADELTGALDSVTGEQVLEILKKLSAEKLVIIVSHDLDLAEKYADRIIRLVDGKVVEDVSLKDEEVKGNIYSSENQVTVKIGSKLSPAETKELAVAVEEKKNIVLTEKFSVRTKRQTVQPEIKQNKEPVKFINSKMKFSSSLSLGLKAVFVKPVRLIVTIMLSFIAFACCGVFDAIASYDDAKAVATILREGYYSALPVYATYSGEVYEDTKIKVSQDYIKEVNEKTGYSFRGVYDLADTEFFSASTAINYNAFKAIENLPSEKVKPVGASFYRKQLNGIIEFKKSEIENNIIDTDGFNFRIIYGEYPQLKGEDAAEEEMQSVAISSYMADSILFWLKSGGVTEFGGKVVAKQEDLLGASISVGNRFFTICGIVDCGTIPSKFDALKEAKDSQLEEDFETFINAGCYLTIFAPWGYVDSYRTENNRAVCYYTDYKNRTYYSFMAGERFQISEYFYHIDEVQDKVVFFDEKKATLGDNEILICISDLKNEYFRKEYSEATAELQSSFDSGLHLLLRADPKASDYRKSWLDPFLDTIKDIQETASLEQGAVKVLKLKGFNNDTADCFTDETFNIVGFYYDIKTDAISTYNYLRFDSLVLSTGGMNSLKLYQDQGIYSKMITPLYKNLTGERTIGKMMNNDNGIELNWFKNSVLDLVAADRETISEFLTLFLYVSIALSLFSVFLLFNYISVSIFSKKQSIGVLRALGANNKNIFIMFLVESLVISILSGLLASIVGWLGCKFVNNYLVEVMNLSLSIALFGSRQIALIIFGSIFAGVLSSIIPIVKVVKEKPVQLIRSS